VIWLIALVPAAIVFLVAVGTQSKGKAIVAAVVAGAVGIFSGNPAYILLDVGSVMIAVSIAWTTVPFRRQAVDTNVKVEPKPVLDKSNSNEGSPVLLWLLIAGAIGVWFVSENKKPVPPANIPNQATARPPHYSPPPATQSQIRPVEVVTTPVKKMPPKKTRMQRCLEILSESEMESCLSNLK